MADDKQERIETLQDRVDELEATVSKMLPSRRDALKLGAAGAVGAVGMAGSASAQNSGQTGTIGTDADRVDVNAEDIDAVSVNTEELLIDGLLDGSTTTALDATSGGVGGLINVQRTENVGTTGKTILRRDGNLNGQAIVVNGSGDGRFVDLLLQTTTSSPNVLGSSTQSGPPSRNYGSDGNNDIQLSMASGTVDVSVVAINAIS